MISWARGYAWRGQVSRGYNPRRKMETLRLETNPEEANREPAHLWLRDWLSAYCCKERVLLGDFRQLVWWAMGLTPEACRSAERFRRSIEDGRSVEEGVAAAMDRAGSTRVRLTDAE